MSSFQHIFSLSFAALLSYIIETWVANDVAIDFLTNSNRVLGVCNSQSISTYDFVVVGGGSAGMVVATRLANNTKDYSVLVLEAGGEVRSLTTNLRLYIMIKRIQLAVTDQRIAINGYASLQQAR